MTLLLGELAGRRVTVLPYVDVMEDERISHAAVRSVTNRLDPALRAPVRPEPAFEAFQPTLRHNRASVADQVENLTSRQLELWRYLSSLGPGSQRLDPPTVLCEPSASALKAVANETERLQSGVAQAQLTSRLDSERQRGVTLSAELDAERRRNDQLSAEVEAERGRNVALAIELDGERKRKRAAIAAQSTAEGWLKALEDSLSWRLTMPLRRAKRLARR
jgi:hypothetical protein